MAKRSGVSDTTAVLGLATIVYQLFDGSAKRRTIEDYAQALRDLGQQAVAQKQLLAQARTQLAERDRMVEDLRRRVSALERENAALKTQGVGTSVKPKAK